MTDSCQTSHLPPVRRLVDIPSTEGWRLQTLDVNLVGPYFWSRNRPCGADSDKPLDADPFLVCNNPAATVRKVVVKALQLIPRNTLKRLRVIDAQLKGLAGDSIMMCSRDLLSDKTVSCPYESMQGSDRDYHEMRMPAFEVQSESCRLDTLEHDAKSTHTNVASVSHFAKAYVLDRAVEGRTWIQTLEGSRFPIEYADTPAGRQHEYIADIRLPREDVVERMGMQDSTTDLWKREAASGRRLLQARITNGLGDVPPLAREVWKFEGDDEEEERFDDEDEDEDEEGGENGGQELCDEEDEGDGEDG